MPLKPRVLAASLLLALGAALIAVLLAGWGKGKSPSSGIDSAQMDYLRLQVRCAQGNSSACTKVDRLDREGCDRGDGHSCTLLAIGHESGKTKDEATAVRLYLKACDLGDAAGCWYAGSRYAQGRGVTKDEAQAEKLLEKACEQKQPNGCLDLGDLRARAKPPRREAALEAYDRGCGLRYEWACNRAKDLRKGAEP